MQIPASASRHLPVPQPEAASFREKGSCVLRGPVITAEKELTESSNDHDNVTVVIDTTPE